MNKDYFYKPDKEQVHEMHKNLNDFKKRLPKAEDVKTLIVEKKKVHRKVIKGEKLEKVSMQSGLQNLHYSQAGPTPRASELGEMKDPPKKFITPYMDNVYKNVNKAMDYKPGEQQPPTFQAEQYVYKGKDETV